MTLALVADIGGTNTRVALADGGVVRQDTIAKFPNRAFTGIDGVLARYMAEAGLASVAGASVAGAGPVQDGAVTMTNLFDENGAAWIIDAPRVMRATGAGTVAVLNDLQAQGQALGHIADANLRPVVEGPRAARGTMLVVGLGTGVNAAPVHNTPWGRVVPPSECGHVTMPVRGAEGLRLQGFIETLLASRREPPHAGVEELLSGRGLGNLHAFAVAEACGGPARDSAAVLAALAAGDPLAEHAARLYTYVLGQMLADQALIHLPYGGIYLIGGMSRAMTPFFDRFGLTTAFREDRRVPLLTRDFAVAVVEDDFAALTGCAVYLANGAKG
ncbi:MAG: glucokinase [Gemmobacter sp.]